MKVCRSLAAALSAAAAVAFLAAGSGPRAGAADARATSGVSSEAGLQLVGQSAWITNSGTFHVQLNVSAPDPSTDTLTGTIYSHLYTRTAFDQTVGGHVQGNQIFHYYSPAIAAMAADLSGAVGVDIPVNQNLANAFGARSGSAVYPVVFQLRDRTGVPLGKPLTTFLTYSSGPSTTSRGLAVSLTVPVTAPVDTGPAPTRLNAGESAALGSLAGVLAGHAGVPLTLAVNPETLDRLAVGSAADRATLASLARTASAGQVVAAPYLPVAAGALAAAGLDSELAAQYQAGATAINAGLHLQPGTGTAVVNGGLDTAALAALQFTGVSRLVLPDGDLSALGAPQRQVTFASPTALSSPKAAPAQVMATDPGLSGMLAAGGDQVLAGEHLLAGLALVQLELPSDQRGVALLEPGGRTPGAALLETVLAGLSGNPFVTAVTADGLFRTVPAAPQVTRNLVGTKAPAPLSQAPAVRAARQAVDGLAAIVPSQSRTASAAQRQLLLATSSVVSPSVRAGLLAQVQATVRQAESGISLPGSSSVTLTARTGTIPLTVLSSPSLHARVQLRITSPKLTLRPFSTSAGSCSISDSSTETCQLTLTSEATTLRIPVESRTSGVFSMQVELASPDGTVVLASNRDTVRSTAFSQVGVILIVVAGLGLVVWWVRNARHGRRARQLIDPTGELRLSDLEAPAPQMPAAQAPTQLPVPPPVLPVAGTSPAAPPPPAGPPAAPNGNGLALPPFPEAGEDRRPAAATDALGAPVAEPITTWVDADPVIAEFFSSPAPDYGGPPGPGDQVSPSGRRRGPNS